MSDTLTGTMSGAELKVALQGLGLGPSWFAQRMDVTMRTVVRWFDGDTVPPVAAEAAEQLAAMTLEEMREVVTYAYATTQEKEKVTLYTYRTDDEFHSPALQLPATWHRALTFRVAEHLRADGRDVTIEYARG